MYPNRFSNWSVGFVNTIPILCYLCVVIPKGFHTCSRILRPNMQPSVLGVIKHRYDKLVEDEFCHLMAKFYEATLNFLLKVASISISLPVSCFERVVSMVCMNSPRFLLRASVMQRESHRARLSVRYNTELRWRMVYLSRGKRRALRTRNLHGICCNPTEVDSISIVALASMRM